MISVLYVDDESALLEVTKNFMERGGGFNVDTAISAQEAIEKLKAERYDALVADYLMPDMDGLVLLKYLRPRCNGMPFILFTGNGSEEIAIDALNSGADFYVQKKGSPRTQFAELETKIRSAVARRQSENILRQSEKDLRSLVEQLTDVIFTVSEDGLITYISPPVSRFGYTPKDLIGKDFAILVGSEDIPFVARHFADIKQGTAASFEFRLVDASGHLHVVYASFSPRMDNGQFAGGQGVLADITASKKDTEEVKKVLDQHQLFFDLSSEGMLIVDPKTGFPVAFNEAACRQLGYTREEFSGLCMHDVEIAGETQKLSENIPALVQKGSITFGARHRTKEGTIRDVVVTARAIDDGSSKKIGLVIHDVTEERKEKQVLAEQAQGSAAIFSQAPLAQLTLAPDGTVTGINQAGTEILGCPADQILGKSLTEFIENNDREQFLRTLEELVRSGRIHVAPFSLIFQDKKVTVSVDGSTVRTDDGTIRQLLVTLTDITEQVRKTADLEAAAISAGGVIAGARDGIVVCNQDQVITTWNPAMEDITGTASQDALEQHLADMLPFVEEKGTDSPPSRALTGEIVATPDTLYEYPATGKRGWLRAIFSPLRDPTGKITGFIGVVQEITTRTKTLLKVKTANQVFSTGAFVGAKVPVVHDLQDLLSETCRVAVDSDVINKAWIGLFDQAAGILRPVAQAGAGEALPTEGFTVTGDPECELVREAIRSGEPAVCSDTETDPVAQPFKDTAQKAGFRSLTVIPFRFNGKIVGVITLCSPHPYAFLPEDTEVLAYLGTSLSLALDLLDKKTLQRRAGRGGHGSWERTRFLAGGIESGAIPFIAVQADGTLWVVNAALCTMLGYTEDELLAIPLSQIFDVSSIDRCIQVLQTKTPDHFETTIRRKEGANLPVELFLQKIPDETSDQMCVGIFITDFSARKHIIDTLETDRQKYHSFFENVSAAVVITAPEGTILAANPAACQLFGRTEEELCSGEGGLAGAGDPRFIELVRSCRENGCAQTELRLVKGDGSSLDVSVEGTQFQDQAGRPLLNLVLRDITGAKHPPGEEALKEEVAAAILDSLPYPVRRADASSNEVFFNKAWFSLTGRTREQELDNGWIEGIHPDDRDNYKKILIKQEDIRDQWISQYRLKNHAGEYRWIQEIYTTDAIGTGFTASCYDIQEFKEAQAACDEKEEQFKAVFENMSDAAFLISNNIIDCNIAATRLFGSSPGDIVGRGLADLSPPYQPDGKRSIDAAEKFLKAARTGAPQAFLWVVAKKDGTNAETNVTLKVLDTTRERYVLAVISDLTEQNRKEREIRRLASYPEMNPNPVIEVRPDHTITYTNPATMAVLSGLGFSDDPSVFIPPDIDEIVASFENKQPVMTVRVIPLKERSFQENICLSPEYNLIRIYAYDITDRVKAMEALAYANHKLGTLTSITRHDIQNKLTGVRGYLELLKGMLRDPKQIEFLEKAEAGAEAIRRHIEFTKEYESLGGTAPVWQEISPVLIEIKSHFDLSGIVFEGPAPRFSVFADPMFGKVLYNLVDNSLRHGVHVRRIRIAATPSDTECVLTYEDDGVGIPGDKKDLIFERGFTTSSGSGKSSGLGLFLARDILAITGIAIKETGTPGAGTRFEMTIPPGKWRNE